jgi:plasmid stabilization system protein ParE
VKVRLSAEAEADIEGIGDFIGRDHPPRAASFVGEIRDACLGLAVFPDRFPLVPRYERHGVRQRMHGNYLIFYRVGVDEVLVIHVLHGAMDYGPILFPQ